MLDLSSSQTKPWLRKASVRSRVKRDLYLVGGDVFYTVWCGLDDLLSSTYFKL